MDALNHPAGPHDAASACRLIRKRWNRKQRRQRREIAQAKQQELWRLLAAAWSAPHGEDLRRPASARDASHAPSSNATGAVSGRS